MSYSEALSARLVPRWEPVSRNQLLVVLLFVFFIHQWRKVLWQNRSQNFCLAVVETVIYHLPLWRFVIYVSVVCLFSGKLQPRRQMLLLPRPGANKGRENGMIPSVILFFFKNIFICGLWLAECSLDEVRMTLQSDCISTGTKTLTAVNLQNIIQFYPRAAVFLFVSVQ